MLGQNLEGNK